MPDAQPRAPEGQTARGVVEAEDLEDFFENAALSLHWVGPDGTIMRANRFELDFLGYRREEYEGRHIAEFHADSDVIDDILRRLTAGEEIHDYPARLLAKDGSIKYVVINSNVRWKDGQFIHTRCFTRDVSDRVAAEHALARANEELEQTVAERTAELQQTNQTLEELVEAKNRFVAMVSHELRTPLTSIAGFSTTMQRYWESLADDQKQGFVQIIGQQSQRLTRLVDDLLTLSRAAAGALEVREHRIALHDVVTQTVRELGIDVEVDVPPDLWVCADRDHLQQILVNYIANAAKYGAPPVEVRARRVAESVEIVVADHGPGVGSDYQPHLFEEFAPRKLEDPADPQPGSGLGLAIVRKLAEAQGGTAWYEGNTPAGAAFGVRLPAAD
jgi:PAS domain S-box-containing protein